MATTTRTSSLHLLIGLFVTTLIVSNIIATKVGVFFGHFLPVAVLLFPISYIIGDVLTEVYGYAVTRRVIWIGFFCNAVATLAIYLGGLVIPAPFFGGEVAYHTILDATVRMFIASLTAYTVGEFANAFILAKLKVRMAGKHLWVRTISSTIIGEGLDSAVFITIAFYGMMPTPALLAMLVTQWLFKVGFEVLATPITYLVIGILKKREQVDYYDRDTNFNPLTIH